MAGERNSFAWLVASRSLALLRRRRRSMDGWDGGAEQVFEPEWPAATESRTHLCESAPRGISCNSLIANAAIKRMRYSEATSAVS